MEPALATATREQVRVGRRTIELSNTAKVNAYAQLAVAPYSVRARPGAPVATPLSWDELDDQTLRPGRFTLRTVPGRIREAGRAAGPWAGLARRRPGLARAQESLRRLAT